ncbi:hypothetical protein J7K28_08730 [Candidatus Aerophobetes bacterium]|nr:hypothetical protein [Candidatus Aerophobetes bacterium]
MAIFLPAFSYGGASFLADELIFLLAIDEAVQLFVLSLLGDVMLHFPFLYVLSIR